MPPYSPAQARGPIFDNERSQGDGKDYGNLTRVLVNNGGEGGLDKQVKR
jgi:hypothetical protein